MFGAAGHCMVQEHDHMGPPRFAAIALVPKRPLSICLTSTLHGGGIRRATACTKSTHLSGGKLGPDQPVLSPVRVLLDGRPVLAQDHTSPEPPIQAALVHHDGILDVVPRVRHDRNSRILPRPQLVVPHQLDGLGGQQGALGIGQEVQQRVHAGQLVESDVAHCLFAHGALVRVARGLVVVGIGDEPRNHPQHGEGLDLQVGRLGPRVGLVQRDQAVVLLVHSPATPPGPLAGNARSSTALTSPASLHDEMLMRR